jgi:hypothetical protein
MPFLLRREIHNPKRQRGISLQATDPSLTRRVVISGTYFGTAPKYLSLAENPGRPAMHQGHGRQLHYGD